MATPEKLTTVLPFEKSMVGWVSIPVFDGILWEANLGEVDLTASPKRKIPRLQALIFRGFGC